MRRRTLRDLETDTRRVFELRNGRIRDKEAAALARNPTASILGLFGNPIGDEGVQALSRSKVLTWLEIDRLSARGVDALAQSSSLSHLCVSEIESVTELARIGVRYLNLDGSNVGDAGAIVLATNTSIVTLFLGNCSISDSGAIALSANICLVKLDLSDNQISDSGAIALSKSNSLTSLDLRNNLVGLEGMKAIVANPRLADVDFYRDRYYFQDDELRDIVDARNAKIPLKENTLYRRCLVRCCGRMMDETVPIEIREDFEEVRHCEGCNSPCIPPPFVKYTYCAIRPKKICSLKCF